MDALLVCGEIDRAVDHRGHHGLGVAAADPHRFLHAGDPGAREREADLGLRRLEVVVELDGVAHGLFEQTGEAPILQGRPPVWQRGQ